MIDDLIVNVEANGWKIKFIKATELNLADFYIKVCMYGWPFSYLSFTDFLEFAKMGAFEYKGVKVKLIK